MAELLSDAAFSTCEITERIVFRDKTFLDSNVDLHVHNVHCDLLTCKVIHVDHGVVNDPSSFLTNDGDRSLGAGGTTRQNARRPSQQDETNTAEGAHAGVFGGTYNEALGDRSVALGGTENQAAGTNSVAMGVAAFAQHDNTMVWNTDPDEPAYSTKPNQCVLGSSGGLFFKLPRSKDIKNADVPDGYACWCWNPDTREVVMKTRQDQVVYVTTPGVSTRVNEWKVSIEPSVEGPEEQQVEVRLLDPDL